MVAFAASFMTSQNKYFLINLMNLMNLVHFHKIRVSISDWRIKIDLVEAVAFGLGDDMAIVLLVGSSSGFDFLTISALIPTEDRLWQQ